MCVYVDCAVVPEAKSTPFFLSVFGALVLLSAFSRVTFGRVRRTNGRTDGTIFRSGRRRRRSWLCWAGTRRDELRLVASFVCRCQYECVLLAIVDRSPAWLLSLQLYTLARPNRSQVQRAKIGQRERERESQEMRGKKEREKKYFPLIYFSFSLFHLSDAFVIDVELFRPLWNIGSIVSRGSRRILAVRVGR